MNGLATPIYDRWVEAIKVVGFPIAVCAFLFLQDTGVVPSRTRDLVVELKGHRADANANAKELAAALNAFRSASRAQVLLTTCLSYARSADIQQRCVEQYQSQTLSPGP